MEPSSPVTIEDRSAAGAPVVVSRWAIHRRLYDWVLAFAHHPHSQTALFILSLAESSIFPVPPDILLAPLCLGMRRRAMRFATITTVGSVLGAFIGYAIGYALLPLGQWIVGAQRIEWLSGEFAQRGDIWVFVAALTPIPFKLLTITAGVAKMNLLVFFLACLLGRAARFYAVAAVFWWVGPRAVPLIDRYFNWLCAAFVILGGLGFAALKLIH